MMMLSDADAMLVEAIDAQSWIAWFERMYLAARVLPSIRTVDAARRAMGDARWFALCRMANLYQVWTRESVACLTGALSRTQARVILEVGAGDGRLTQAIARAGLSIVGQDDGSWAADQHVGTTVMAIRHESIEESLATVRPDTVIVSWMPYETDWTPLFRACPSVRRYFVIGEGEGGCTGTEELFHPPVPWSIREVPGFQRVAASRTDVPDGSLTSLWHVRKTD